LPGRVKHGPAKNAENIGDIIQAIFHLVGKKPLSEKHEAIGPCGFRNTWTGRSRKGRQKALRADEPSLRHVIQLFQGILYFLAQGLEFTGLFIIGFPGKCLGGHKFHTAGGFADGVIREADEDLVQHIGGMGIMFRSHVYGFSQELLYLTFHFSTLWQ
jgi:hypothetical protein